MLPTWGAGAMAGLISFATQEAGQLLVHSAPTACTQNWSTILSRGSLPPLSSSYPKEIERFVGDLVIENTIGFGIGRVELESFLCYLLAVCRCVNSQASLSLGILIFQMRVITSHTAGKPN